MWTGLDGIFIMLFLLISSLKCSGITNMLHLIKEFVIIIVFDVKMSSKRGSRVGFVLKCKFDIVIRKEELKNIHLI